MKKTNPIPAKMSTKVKFVTNSQKNLQLRWPSFFTCPGTKSPPPLCCFCTKWQPVPGSCLKWARNEAAKEFQEKKDKLTRFPILFTLLHFQTAVNRAEKAGTGFPHYLCYREAWVSGRGFSGCQTIIWVHTSDVPIPFNGKCLRFLP